MRTGLILILVVLTSPMLIHAENLPPLDKTLSPYFFVKDDSLGIEAFPLKSTNVRVNISGVIADVTVTQVYENQGSVPINGKYVFPGSTRAAVHGLRMRIGEKTVVARIKERQQAAKEFAEATAAGKSASLLEQQRPNVFTMSVANILPGDRVEVELVYSELLKPEEGIYQFVYPAVVGPRYSSLPESAASEISRWVKSPFLHQGESSPAKLAIHVNLSTGVPLADLRCTSHDAKVAWEGPAVASVVLDNDAGNREFILDYRLAGKEIESGLLLFESPKENFFLLTVQPPARIAETDITPREYIFVLDVSGSMHGFPLDTAKEVMRNLIGNLKPTDTFNVILFSGGSRVLSPRSLSANATNITRAFSVIDREKGGGGTELEAALRIAMQLPRSDFVSRSIVVVTDGYIAEEREAFTMIDQNLNNTNVFAFGVGSSVNRHLIEGVAMAGQGEPFTVTTPAEAGAMGDRFRRYIESPVLTNIKVSYAGFDAYDVEPDTQADLFAERPVVLFGKWHGPKQGQIEVSGRTASGTFTRVFEVKDSSNRPEHAALPQLWARTRIARLSDFNFQSDDAESVREVTSLGLTYSLLTRYTSFIAVLEEVRNKTGQVKDVDQPLPMPAGVSDLAVGYGSGAEPSVWVLLAGTALLLAMIIRARQGTSSC